MGQTRSHRSSGIVMMLIMSTVSAHLSAGTSDYLDLRRIGAVHGDADAGKREASVCGACHGAMGVSAVPAFPNLAGQHAEYLYGQLLEFKRDARPDSPMTAQVSSLDDASMRNLATYFASLPRIAPGANGAAVDISGGKLYREGDPTRGIPPCQGCHGADGSGQPLAQDNARWRIYPALRGQHADYLVQRLKDFRNGKLHSSSSDHIMTPIARTLDESSMRELAEWIELGLSRSP